MQRPLLVQRTVRTEAPPPTEAQWGYYQRLCRDTRITPRTDLNRQTMSREIDLSAGEIGARLTTRARGAGRGLRCGEDALVDAGHAAA